MTAPGSLAQSSEGCLVLEVHRYAPPAELAELAAAVALWAVAALAAALAVYWLVRAVTAWRRRHGGSWLAGYEAGRAARFNSGPVVPFPGSPAA